jgi:hypothetical protein
MRAPSLRTSGCYPNVRDGTDAVARDWGVTGLPETFMYSRDPLHALLDRLGSAVARTAEALAVAPPPAANRDLQLSRQVVELVEQLEALRYQTRQLPWVESSNAQLVVLFDDLDKWEAEPIYSLLGRLVSRVEPIPVVGASLREPLSTLNSHGAVAFRTLRLGPLSPERWRLGLEEMALCGVGTGGRYVVDPRHRSQWEVMAAGAAGSDTSPKRWMEIEALLSMAVQLGVLREEYDEHHLSAFLGLAPASEHPISPDPPTRRP